jgi:hypothetical protein
MYGEEKNQGDVGSTFNKKRLAVEDPLLRCSRGSASNIKRLLAGKQRRRVYLCDPVTAAMSVRLSAAAAAQTLGMV